MQFHKRLEYNAGVIIYPDKDELPQEVIFIPYQRIFGLTWNDDMRKALVTCSKNTITVYFSNMKWVQDDILATLVNSKYEKAQLMGDRIISVDFEKKFDNSRVTFGIVVCDLTFNDQRPIYEPLPINHAELHLDSIVYRFECEDMPRSFGVPVQFIEYDLGDFDSGNKDMLRFGKN